MKTSIVPGPALAASLALTAVLGPSAIDMYLASLPDMAQELGASYATVQLTLTVFLLAMGAGQLVFGPLIDAWGRRRLLLAGIFVFVAASLWAATVGSIGALLAARFCQGMAAALTLVVAVSTVRDVADGARAARLFALLMTIQGLAPVLAPAVGGYVDALFGWRAVMLVLAALGLAALGNAVVNLPETLPLARRIALRPAGVLRTYGAILRDGAFLLPALALSGAFFFLFAYIGGASLVYQRHYGLAPQTFGLVFGGTGLAVLLGALASARLVARTSVGTLAVRGVLLMTAGAVVAATGALAGWGLPVIVAGMFVALLGLGLAEPTLMTLAMSSRQDHLGSSAALLGGMQMVIAAAATPLAGRLAEQGARDWTLFLALCGMFVLLLASASARRAPEVTGLAAH